MPFYPLRNAGSHQRVRPGVGGGGAKYPCSNPTHIRPIAIFHNMSFFREESDFADDTWSPPEISKIDQISTIETNVAIVHF